MGNLLPNQFIFSIYLQNKYPYWQRFINNYLMAGDLKYA